MSYTPGPWDDASNYPGVDSVRIFAQTHYIATVGNSDDTRDVTEANARLIAAAPDMLAKLKEIHGEMACSCRLEHFVDGPVPCKTCQIALVIAKAEATP